MANKLEKEAIRELFDNIQSLIPSSRTKVALTVNREITFCIGKLGKKLMEGS